MTSGRATVVIEKGRRQVVDRKGRKYSTDTQKVIGAYLATENTRLSDGTTIRAFGDHPIMHDTIHLIQTTTGLAYDQAREQAAQQLAEQGVRYPDIQYHTIDGNHTYSCISARAELRQATSKQTPH